MKQADRPFLFFFLFSAFPFVATWTLSFIRDWQLGPLCFKVFPIRMRQIFSSYIDNIEQLQISNEFATCPFSIPTFLSRFFSSIHPEVFVFRRLPFSFFFV